MAPSSGTTNGATRSPFTAEEAARGAEARGKVQAAQGRYGVVVDADALPDGSGGSLPPKLRALHVDLPVVAPAPRTGIVSLRGRCEADGCVSVIAKPYEFGDPQETLRGLGASCGQARL